ncbi:MAG: hypothetical protein AAGJ31_11895 [Verrucomicrobiota bacterium]
MPKLRCDGVIIRGNHSILTTNDPFPELEICHGTAVRLEESSGLSCCLEHWTEAWWYEEQRFGRWVPTLEIVDGLGRGLVKLCYAEPEDAEADRPLVEPLIRERGSDWDLIHVRRSNYMDCSRSHRSCGGANISERLKKIWWEAHQRGASMGVIVSSDQQTAWRSLVPKVINCRCCWATFGDGRDFVHVELPGMIRSETYPHEHRAVVKFMDERDKPTLTLIAPDGVSLSSMRHD